MSTRFRKSALVVLLENSTVVILEAYHEKFIISHTYPHTFLSFLLSDHYLVYLKVKDNTDQYLTIKSLSSSTKWQNSQHRTVVPIELTIMDLLGTFFSIFFNKHRLTLA